MSFVKWNFDFFYSIPFWILALFIALVGRTLRRWVTGKRLFLAVTSAFMLLAIPGFGMFSLGLVFVLSLLTYFIGAWLLGGPDDRSVARRKLVAGIGIAAVLSFLAVFKYRLIHELFRPVSTIGGAASTNIIRIVGVSYFSFRMIHFVIESYRKRIQNLEPLTYIDYVIFFPAFISGPINRYNDFESQISSSASSALGSDLRVGSERIVHGLFKKLVIARLLYPLIISVQPDVLSKMGLSQAAIGLYAYALYSYFDFAGYTDLAIGCAHLIGVRLPENFNRPFVKKNIREFWTNWHMSLTSWLVEYIYWPIVRKFRGFDYFRRHPVFLSNLGMIITFMACGIWHGEAVNFVLWGVYHGIGISCLTIYQRIKRKTRSQLLLRYFNSKTSVVLGIALTTSFFALGMSLFALDIARLRILIKAVISRL